MAYILSNGLVMLVSGEIITMSEFNELKNNLI